MQYLLLEVLDAVFLDSFMKHCPRPHVAVIDVVCLVLADVDFPVDLVRDLIDEIMPHLKMFYMT